MNIQEVAPPTKKHERMVKHIKKSYKKDGKLTDDEKSIAYATAWKNYNKEEVVLEKDLNAAERRALPDSDFALPGKGEGPEGKQRGAYPINDKKHARNALAMAAAHASPEKEAKVKAAVKKKFPDIEQSEDWKPEIEVIDTKKEVKKREKKRKEAESSLPPHLRLDAMKKAFAHTNESVVLDANTKIKTDEKKKKKEAELRRLLKHAIAVKKGQAESFEIDKSAHKKVQKKAKLRNLAKGNMNPNEKAAAEKKAGGPKLYGEGAAWTKKSGKNPEGGLNEKGRKSYERDNPGSDLKAPQPEGGSRKKSFCARMGGMKKKLTSSKTANDPDSRINKALRKWKCNEESKGLYANIHAKRKRGERPAKPGEKGYPKPGAFASAEKTTKEELAFEGWQDRAKEAMKRVAGKKPTKKHDYGRDAGKIAKELIRKKDHQSVNFLDPDD